MKVRDENWHGLDDGERALPITRNLAIGLGIGGFVGRHGICGGRGSSRLGPRGRKKPRSVERTPTVAVPAAWKEARNPGEASSAIAAVQNSIHGLGMSFSEQWDQAVETWGALTMPQHLTK